MQVVLLRIGIDTGSGGIHGPLFQDGTFEYIPIPDNDGVDERTYGNTVGRQGVPLVDYFRTEYRRAQMANRRIHFDPEFETFTYGDPTPPKSGLNKLHSGDMLVFYCGLRGWDFEQDPALYLMGYFEVQAAGRAVEFDPQEIHELFSRNFHVRHPSIYERQKAHLILVKGSPSSRLLNKAVRLSSVGEDRAGAPLHVVSSEMQRIFGDFGGKVSIQRSPPRWVDEVLAQQAAEFMRSLD